MTASMSRRFEWRLERPRACRWVREAVEERDARVVVIDSLNGYLHAMPEESFLILQLHELLLQTKQLFEIDPAVDPVSGLPDWQSTRVRVVRI